MTTTAPQWVLKADHLAERAAPWLDGALAINVALMLVILLVRDLVYQSVRHLIFLSSLFNTGNLTDAFFWLLALRLLCFRPWRMLFQEGWRRRVLAVTAMLLIVRMIHDVSTDFLPLALHRTSIDQLAFADNTPTEIAADIHRSHLLYPDQQVLEEVLATVPADAREGILYFSDQRPYIWAHLLYPRPVFTLPELQRELNAAVEGSWEWSGIRDPIQSIPDPLRKPTLAEPPILPQTQARVRQMMARQPIRWVFYYDSVWPDRSFIHRVASSEATETAH